MFVLHEEGESILQSYSFLAADSAFDLESESMASSAAGKANSEDFRSFESVSYRLIPMFESVSYPLFLKVFH
jgi:hypothetical protein